MADLSINPEMIALGRQARGLTQSGLATRAGVAQGTISKIEAGVTSPTPADVLAIAEGLDFPTAFFFQQRRIPGPGLSELFHRKRQRVGAKVLNQVHAVSAVRLMAVDDLLTACDLDNNIPYLAIDEFDGSPEKIARTVRALWQLPPGPVFNLTSTTEQNGGAVVLSQLGTRLLDGFSRRSLTDERPFFFMSNLLPPDRWRWTLAHEIGHMVMHMDAFGRPEKEIEAEADQFAGELLTPGHEIKPDFWGLSLEKLAGLKRYWKVSMAALIRRAFHLNALTPSQYQRLFIELSRAGYRLREPEELDPPVERPTLIPQLADFYMDELHYSTMDLEVALKLNAQDIHGLRYPEKPLLRIAES